MGSRTLIKTIDGKVVGTSYDHGEKVKVQGFVEPATILAFGRFFVTVNLAGKTHSVPPTHISKWTEEIK